MTVSTQLSQNTFLGNSATSVFTVDFIMGSEDYIQVFYTDEDGEFGLVPASQYTVFINPAAPGQLWGVGGTITYPLAGDPIPDGSSLLVTRIVPLTQVVAISNQGSFYPRVTETGMDTLEFQIQQISNRTGRLLGCWVSGVDYNYADVVQDCAAGLNTGNYYFCTLPHTSGVWADDLAAGYWSLAIDVESIVETVDQNSISQYLSDFVFPASSTDMAIVRWDGTDGNKLQNSNVIVNDSDAIYGFVSDIVSDGSASITISQSEHGGRTLRTTRSSSVTVTFPSTLPVGAEGEIIQDGAGTVSFAAGSGATIQNRQSFSATAGRYAAMRWKVVTNTDDASAVINLAGDMA